MDAHSVRSEIMRLLLKKSHLQKQEAALKEMLVVVEKQMLGLEVEGYQLASDIRMKDTPADCESESEPECIDSEPLMSEEELNKTKLNLDSRLDDMLSGKFYVEEDEDDEKEDLISF